MTFKTCEKLITIKKARLVGEDWVAYTEDMKNKLDIFLLNSRITEEQYNTLITMMQ